MERYHNIVKIEKVKKCLEQGEVTNALVLAQTINRKKIKNLSDLSIMAEVFFQNNCYDEAREIFLSIYSKNKSRRILAQIVHLSIKLNDVVNSEKYLEEFKELAPKDIYCHIFRYNIDKMAGKDIDVLIKDLEALKKDSYMENWAYELAKLYHKAGDKRKCIDECSNLILWFGNGVYVEKAKALKAYYTGELDLSEIEGKEHKYDEELIAKQIQNILSEFEAKEKARVKEETSPSKAKEAFVEDEYKHDVNDFERHNDKEDAVNTNEIEIVNEVEHTNDIENTVLKKSEIEAMKKTLLKQVNCLESDTANDYDGALIWNNPNSEEITEDRRKKPSIDCDDNNRFKLWKDQNSKIREKNGFDTKLDQEQRVEDVLSEYEFHIERVLGNYKRMDIVGDKILSSLQEIVKDNFLDVSFIITGSYASGKTYLAKSILKIIRKMNSNISSKLALIDAERLNGIDWDEKKDQLLHCTLIIEHAGNLNSNSINELLNLYHDSSNSIFIFIEDTMENINLLLENNLQFKKIFKHRIELPNYTVEDYLGFAYDYLTEREYQIEEDAFLLLQVKIEKQMSMINEYSLKHVFSFMQGVIKKAENRNAKQLLYQAQSGTLKGADLLIIKKQDIDVL